MKVKTKAKLALFYAKHRMWLVPVAVLAVGGVGYVVYTQFLS